MSKASSIYCLKHKTIIIANGKFTLLMYVPLVPNADSIPKEVNEIHPDKFT